MKKSKIVLAVSIVMSIVMVVTGTFAWFTSRDQKTNHFETKSAYDGSVCLYELFTPPTDWKPGQCITKNVAAYNNGDSDMLVRISFEEALSKLKAKGEIVKIASKTGSAGYIPVYASVNPDQRIKDGWKYAVASNFPNNTLPADCKIIYNTTKLDGNTTYSFVIFNEITAATQSTAGVYQKMSADIKVENGLFVVSNKLYWFYQGYDDSTYDWAGMNEIIQGGTKTIKAPAAPTKVNATKIQLDSKIFLNYGQVDFDNITAGKWYYNAADGYFYYIGKVTPGMITPLLLSTVSLSGDADNSYSLMKLDLHVLLDGIQNTTEAIKADNAWKLPDTGNLFNALKAYCVY